MGIALLMLGNSFRCNKHPQIAHITIAAEPVNTSPIYRVKVDNINSYILIDGRASGVYYSELRSAMTVSAYNSTSTNITFPRGDGDLVCTGDTVTFEAKNSTASSSIMYTIVVLGDVNSDGVVIADLESPDSDTVILTEAIDETRELTINQILAGNLHEQDKLMITIADCQAIMVKVENLDEYLQAIINGVTSCEHEGGIATCTTLATCTKCGESYGEFADHVYPVIHESDIQWVGGPGRDCTSAQLVVNCSVCGGGTISEYGTLSTKYYEPSECGEGIEDCSVYFENDLFKHLNGESCHWYHEYAGHIDYTETGKTEGDCLTTKKRIMTCMCGEDSYTQDTEELGEHDWGDGWGPLSGVNKHSRGCTICEAYEEGSCVMLEPSISYSAAPTMSNKHWVNGTCEECGRPMQYSEPCEFEDGNVCWKCNCEQQ